MLGKNKLSLFVLSSLIEYILLNKFSHVLFNCVLTISQRTLLIDFGDLFGNPANPILAYSRSPLNLGAELNCQQQSPLFSTWSSFRLLRILLGKFEYLNPFGLRGQHYGPLAKNWPKIPKMYFSLKFHW